MNADWHAKRSRTGTVALAVLLLAAGGRAAFAGAWTLEPGRGLAIVTVERIEADDRFEHGRERVRTPRFRKTEARALLEYGLAERVTLRAKTAVEEWRQEASAPVRHRGAGVQELGARLKLHEKGSLVASVESSLRVADAFETATLEYEVRLLAGAGFTLAGLPAFADAQAGYRFCPDCVADKIVADLTLGLRPHEKTLLLLQSFSTIAARPADDGWPLHDRHRVTASLVYDLTERWSVQLGAGTTIAGRDALAERSGLAALWLRF